jgi:hypothetical protein
MTTSQPTADVGDPSQGAVRGILFALTLGVALWTAILLLVLMVT